MRLFQKRFLCVLLAAAIVCSNAGTFVSSAVSPADITEEARQYAGEEPEEDMTGEQQEKKGKLQEEDRSEGQQDAEERTKTEGNSRPEAGGEGFAGEQTPSAPEESEAPLGKPEEGDKSPELPENGENSDLGQPEEEMVGDAVEVPNLQDVEEEPKENTGNPYWNYVYGDPSYNGNYTVTDEEGNELPELYEDDLNEIIRMAEEGMDLSVFFHGTVYENVTLEQLRQIWESGFTLDSLTAGYYSGRTEMPEELARILADTDPSGGIMLTAAGAMPGSLTATGVRSLSGGALGVEPVLGASRSHGPVVKLQAAGGGTSYDGFCGSYGSSFRNNYLYSQADYHEMMTPNGAALNDAQYTVIQFVIAAYLKTTVQTDADYAGAQAAIWYAINNPSAPEEFYWRGWEGYNDDGLPSGNGALMNIAEKIAGGRDNAVYNGIYGFISTVAVLYDAYREGRVTMEDFSGVTGFDYFPGQTPEVYFYRSNVSNAQWFLTWNITDEPAAGPTASGIPIINNYYAEKEAVARYNIDITKESIITNELLEDFQFEVVESVSSGDALDYTVKTGSAAGMGSSDYAHPDTEGGATTATYGTYTEIADPVPYMDDDAEPSQGRHRTVVTTDENGHAYTTFVHRHTFREYWSECRDGNLRVIDKAAYDALWENALKMADGLLPGATASVTYLGASVEMTADEIRAVHDAQMVVYTQTRDEAMKTIDDNYNAYKDRKYTYTVTELTPYTRAGDTDSNGNVMDSIQLPHDGYRKDVQDVTTVGSYEQVLGDGETMIPGGANDQDPNTNELNITNEPWYNQIFIHKTDLESGNQILYDTDFDIYEYYQYKVTLETAKIPLYPALIASSYRNEENGARIDPDTVTEAVLHVYATGGAEVFTKELDAEKLKAAMKGTATDYEVPFETTHSGAFMVKLEMTVDASLSAGGGKRVLTDSGISEPEACACSSVCDAENCPVCRANADYCRLNGEAYSVYTFTGGEPKAEMITEYRPAEGENAWFQTAYSTYSSVRNAESGETIYKNEQTGKSYNSKDGAYIGTRLTNGVSQSTFFYTQPADDVWLFSKDDGKNYEIYGVTERYSHFTQEDGTITLYYGNGLESGTYGDMEYWVSVDAAQIMRREIDRDVKTDPDDYTTWGLSQNYEIVRVTADIARKMGWSDTTIGMYTVHRLSPTDQYCGTTFSSHYDESDKSYRYGYDGYGTLYYTQANQGLFAIVEKTAPADGSRSGYLGNYDDRSYDYLDREGSPSADMQSQTMDQKNYDGDPPAAEDSLSMVKYVHYIDLCTDTNQYATYMLTDGYNGYDSVYYNNYVDVLTDEASSEVPTEDGYDALYYDQSSLKKNIGLQRFELEDPLNDVLNEYWDRWFSDYLSRASGQRVNRNSEKTDTWMKLKQKTDLIHHYAGTTINKDSFDNHDASQSDIAYDGTYTDTHINYHSYAGDTAEALNQRDGFHDVEYLQAGTVIYDNMDEEKQARYYHTEGSVSKEPGYAFIDEREYGYLRFSKYDADAQRYVDGDLQKDYLAGTDHADADLDGAVYSLYVDESNRFEVTYLEGKKNGQLFWAQPLTGGGYTLIYDGDDDAENGFTDKGNNRTEAYPHAYVEHAAEGRKILHFDYGLDAEEDELAEVAEKTAVYHGIRHPDGRYGGEKHNGFFAVLEEQQVFVDTDNNGYADTWTLQDVTLYAGAKAASAVIRDGELSMDGLYLGTYYLAEEIRDAITIYSLTNDDVERAENRWLSFAAGYTADTDEHGNPTHYVYRFPYVGMDADSGHYDAEQDYVHKDTVQVSNQQAVKGGSVQIEKTTNHGESGSSNNTDSEPLEGAGFTVYLLSELSVITGNVLDEKGSVIQTVEPIAPAYSEYEGHQLVERNVLTEIYDDSGNMAGYQHSREYMEQEGLYDYFSQKYPQGYDLEDVNRLVYIKNRGYYYIRDILDKYRDQHYDEHTRKWDFSEENAAVARIYEEDEGYIDRINADFDYVTNHLNNGSPCEYYGKNGLSEGWTATGGRNEYRLAEIFSNHYGRIRIPELAWGAYVVVETTTPADVFTVEPYFFAVTDSSASLNRSRPVVMDDSPFVASLFMVKRDAQSGQDVTQVDMRYRIWDYTRRQYVEKYLFGENGGLSMVARRVFTTDAEGRINAVASLESGHYRLEELTARDGLHNMFWDYGNWTDGEQLGGIGADASVPNYDNMFNKYYGSVDFEITTERLYKSSGITASDNLDYIYVGEYYYNDEVQGKLTITKTGEVLADYCDTDDVEYADEYRGVSEADFNGRKSMSRERQIFEKIRDHYGLGRDRTVTRERSRKVIIEKIIPVKYFITDANGNYAAAVYEAEDGRLLTLSGGEVKKGDKTLTIEYELSADTLENAELEEAENTWIYREAGASVNTDHLAYDEDGILTTSDRGTLSLNDDGSYTLTYDEAVYDPGNTWDFVYEERPLAGATFIVRAAEDIRTQDGGKDNLWFKKGDIAATVTTANEGEFVSFAPSYNAGGSYDSTYYYGNTEENYTSLTQEKEYQAGEFSTSGSVENHWTEERMTDLERSLFGVPAYTEDAIYPNTFYRENVQRIYRRIARESESNDVRVSGYQTRLEAEGGLASEGYGVLTQTADGFSMTYTETAEYPDARLKKNGDYYLLTGTGRAGDDIDIEAAASDIMYEVTESLDGSLPWKAGDYAVKTALGYRLVHTEKEAAADNGADVDGAADLGYTTIVFYPDAVLHDDGEGIWTLSDRDGKEIVRMRSGLLVTEAGGILSKAGSGYEITYVLQEEYTANKYVVPSLQPAEATLTIKDEEYHLHWVSADQSFETDFGTKVSFSDDFSAVTVDTNGDRTTYHAFDMLMEYDFHYAQRENIVSVEKDGTLGAVSLYLPLGRYTVQEIASPYGFLLNEQPQTVEFTAADQVKEIVFNQEDSSVQTTQKQMDVWADKALAWFVGGLNTIGEKLLDRLGVNHYTWGSYGDAEMPYYEDAEGFINTFDLRVKAWSRPETPEPPEDPDKDPRPDPEESKPEPGDPQRERHEESEENQWNLGVGIFKADAETKKPLPDTKFGLYTRDNIYNADGKLLVKEGSLLATAVTDDDGFANFAVDIALLSKWNDPKAKDDTLVYQKTVTSGDESYTVTESIDGNTGANSGQYYIRELTPPDGYLLDDTVYPVEFRYAGDKTMYIPVYAKHENEPTKLSLNKMDLTGQKEVPGARISLYRIIDISDADGDGRISHADGNLELLDTWVSKETPHEVARLLLSNDEWPRLDNEEIRENIYVWREEVPAAGYVTAEDIEFKLYQTQGEDGWIDSGTEGPYGYKVLIRTDSCDQDYLSGVLISPNSHADGQDAAGGTWDYTETLDGYTEIRWLLVSRNLVLSFTEQANADTAGKLLREEDFADLEFDTVYLDFEGEERFKVDFFSERQVSSRPEGAYVTHSRMWYALEDLHMEMYDDVTKVKFGKQDLATGKDVPGARLRVLDESGHVIDEWITAVDEQGNTVDHYMEQVLEAGKTYVLEETLAPTGDGYVRSNSVRFTVEDDGTVQKAVMEDDFTKLEISKADITTGEEIDGAMLEIWSVDRSGRRLKKMDSWTTGDDGHEADGRPKRHRIDYLPVGEYVLTEVMAPAGYLAAEDVSFMITESGLLQQVQMLDASSRFRILKYRTDTTEFVPGATIKIYEIPEHYVPQLLNRAGVRIQLDGSGTADDTLPDEEADDGKLEIHLTGEDLRATVKTQSRPVPVDGLDAGWYAAMETQAPRGYLLDETPQIFQIVEATGQQTLTFYNQNEEEPEKPEKPEPDPEPEEHPEEPVGTLELSIDNGYWWNNVRTEDSGEAGSSILLTIEPENGFPYLMLLAGTLIIAGGCAGLYLYMRRWNTRR